jgi:hypothetical protein
MINTSNIGKKNIEDFEKEFNKIIKSDKINISKKEKELNDLKDPLYTIKSSNLHLKKENFDLKSKLKILDMEYKNKYDSDMLIKEKELKEFKEKIYEQEKHIKELKNVIIKKKEIIANKKQLNIILCDLGKIKKAEVQLIEALKITKSEDLRKTLENLRDNEKDLLNR